MEIQTFIEAEATRLALAPMPRDPGERWRQKVYRRKLERLTGACISPCPKPRRRRVYKIVRDDFGWPDYGW